MSINKPNKYFAFISYNREDEEWAVWFHHELENYHLPATLNGRTDLPTEFRPVFRDIDELKAGNLPEQIYDALATSTYLIVICSPNSAKSEWVNKEIRDFIEIGKTKGLDNVRNIFPFIVGGIPHAKNETEECFPKMLLELDKDQERIGGNVNESGRDKAFVKVMAGMLPNVAFDDLWNRYEQDKAEEERVERERKNNLLRLQSRFVAEKAMTIADDDSYLARLLALEMLPKDLERYERPYTIEAERALRVVVSKNNYVLRGHTDRIFSSVISKDGKLIVSASRDNTVRIWMASSGKVLKVLKGHSSYVDFATFSPDSRRVVSASHDKTLILWDVISGQPIRKFIGHSDFVTYVSFSPDGRQITSASADMTLIVWEVETGSILKRWKGHSEMVNSVEYFPWGEMVVSTSDDRTVKCWNVKTGALVTQLECYYWVNHASCSPDGKMIVLSLANAVVGIWDVTTGKITSLTGHADVVNSAFFSPDGKKIVSTSGDSTIKIWDVAKRELIKTLNCHYNGVNYAEFSSDGSKIVSASDDRTIRVDCEDSQQERDYGFKESMGVYFIPNISYDGERIASSTLSAGALRIWNLKNGELVRELCKTDSTGFAAFSFDGKRVASFMKGGLLNIWDVETGMLKKSYRHKMFDLFSQPAFSPGESLMAYAMNDYSIVLYDIKENKVVEVFKGHADHIDLLAFTPDGSRLISGSRDNTIKIWSKDSEQFIMSLEKHKDRINTVSFNSDGSVLISTSNDHTFILWDMKTGDSLWINEGHADGVSSASFSSDSSLLVSTSNSFIKVWDVADQSEIMTFEWQGQTVIDARFCNNGREIMSISMEHNIRYWHFPPLQELIDQTRERFKDRPLTQEERRQYYLE